MGSLILTLLTILIAGADKGESSLQTHPNRSVCITESYNRTTEDVNLIHNVTHSPFYSSLSPSEATTSNGTQRVDEAQDGWPRIKFVRKHDLQKPLPSIICGQKTNTTDGVTIIIFNIKHDNFTEKEAINNISDHFTPYLLELQNLKELMIRKEPEADARLLLNIFRVQTAILALRDAVKARSRPTRSLTHDSDWDELFDYSKDLFVSSVEDFGKLLKNITGSIEKKVRGSRKIRRSVPERESQTIITSINSLADNIVNTDWDLLMNQDSETENISSTQVTTGEYKKTSDVLMSTNWSGASEDHIQSSTNAGSTGNSKNGIGNQVLLNSAIHEAVDYSKEREDVVDTEIKKVTPIVLDIKTQKVQTVVNSSHSASAFRSKVLKDDVYYEQTRELDAELKKICEDVKHSDLLGENDKNGAEYMASVTLPSFAGLLLVSILCCVCLRPNGRFCRIFNEKRERVLYVNPDTASS